MRFSVRKKGSAPSAAASGDAPHDPIDRLFRRPRGSADIYRDLQNKYASASNQDINPNGACRAEPALLDAVKTIALPQLFARFQIAEKSLPPVDLRVGGWCTG